MMEDLRNPERQLANIAFIVSRGAELYPDRTAIDDLLSDRRLSYGELDARVTRLARAMMRAGVEKGDMVAAMFWNEHAIVEAIFACARIGAIVAPLNVRLLPSDVAEYVNDHDCRAIVANADFTDRFADAAPTIRIARGETGDRSWQGYETVLAAETNEYLPVTMSFDEPYRLVSTGGTTGKSKGVLHSHVGMFLRFSPISRNTAFAADGRRCRCCQPITSPEWNGDCLPFCGGAGPLSFRRPRRSIRCAILPKSARATLNTCRWCRP